MPSDPWETEQAIRAAAAMDGPVFVRVSRMPVPEIVRKNAKFEIGKYINPRTFLSAQWQARQPGITIDHRTRDGWRFYGGLEPRLILKEPRLNQQPVDRVRSYGGFIAREWRF